ncbi:hypothetical protein DL769_003697 [Monosporascus sp. CRB-8-3]|nr:hypothetical protein DL769_003697 [Monosporascus sp. CRB-8-3]
MQKIGVFEPTLPIAITSRLMLRSRKALNQKPSKDRQDASNLRKQLAESQLSQEQLYRGSAAPVDWNARMRAAAAAGFRRPERYFPVLISKEEGILSSPGQLKKLADIPETPKIIKMTWTTRLGSGDPANRNNGEEAEVCNVAEPHWVTLYRRAEIEEDSDRLVWIGDTPRVAVVVIAIKKSSTPTKTT